MIHDPVIEKPSSMDSALKEIEIVPEHLSSEITLSIEEIPPLDVFYSPKHRVVVKRQRKKRNIDQASVKVPQNESMNVIWRDSEVNPSEDLTKLYQFAGAYTTATIDKATEVNQFFKEKDQKIKQLKEQLRVENQRIDQQALERQQQLSQEFKQLKITHHEEMKSRYEQIK